MTEQETRAQTPAARLVRRLAAVREILADLPDSAHVRELREAHRSALDQCTGATDETLRGPTLREKVEDLYAKAEAARRQSGLTTIPPPASEQHLATPIAWAATDAEEPKR